MFKWLTKEGRKLRKWWGKYGALILACWPVVWDLIEAASKLNMPGLDKAIWVLDELLKTPIADKFGLTTQQGKDTARTIIKIIYDIWKWSK